VWVTVTTPDEADAASMAGADAAIVQGVEAGGHRGGFNDGAPGELGLLALLQLVVARVGDRMPLVASGGIATGRGVAAVLASGAAAAQLGTAFMLCPEAATAPAHRDAIASGQAPTALTRAYTGRTARGIVNRFMREHSADAPSAYPEVHHLTAPIRAAARQRNDAADSTLRTAPTGLSLIAQRSSRRVSGREGRGRGHNRVGRFRSGAPAPSTRPVSAAVVRAGERVPADADLGDGLGVHPHLPHDTLARRSGHETEVVHDEIGVNDRPPKLLVAGQRSALFRAAVHHEEPAEVTAVGIEQRHVHPRDPAVGLHALEHLDELAEDLDSAFLAAAYRSAEPHEQGSIGHHDSFLLLDTLNLSKRARPCNPARNGPQPGGRLPPDAHARTRNPAPRARATEPSPASRALRKRGSPAVAEARAYAERGPRKGAWCFWVSSVPVI
jgi:Nitronate monooxygenase